MKKPELVIMAAGMGSRYGGLKQIDTVDPQGHIIIDYSIFDAMRAGFRDFTFIIKKEIEKDFREVIDSHVEGKGINVKYVYQEIDKLPEGAVTVVPETTVVPDKTETLKTEEPVIKPPVTSDDKDDIDIETLKNIAYVAAGVFGGIVLVFIFVVIKSHRKSRWG